MSTKTLRERLAAIADDDKRWAYGVAGDAVERAERLEAQLPEDMKECTIQFKECEKGHGWLTATNWVQHGCPTCRVQELEAALLDIQRLNHSWGRDTQMAIAATINAAIKGA